MNRSVNANPRRNPALFILILVPLIAAGIAWWCTTSGIGVSPDSVIYLSAADSLLAGRELKPIAYHFTPTVASGKPLVVFPPTYPLLLSFTGLLSSDRLNAARWFASLLFAANICLLGVIVYLATNRSAMAAITAMLLPLSSARFLEIHTMAWSEPPFILFILLAVLLLTLYIRSSHYLLLIGASASASLAMTTRYAGVTILLPMMLTILLLGDKHFRKRVRDCVVLVTIAVVPLAAWLVRNEMTADSATNRTAAIHLVGVSDISKIANALLLFELPATGNSYLRIALTLLGCGLIVIALALSLKGTLSSNQGAEMKSTEFCAAAFVITYLLFLVAYNSLADPAVELDTRTVLPAYVIGIILIISSVYRLSRFPSRSTIWRGFLVLSLVLVTANAVRVSSFAMHRHDNGVGFASREWAGSATLTYLRNQSDGRTIYSNGIDAIHFLTGREALRVPAKVDRITGKLNTTFEQDMSTLRNELLQNQSLVVYFDRVTWRWYLPSKDELENVYKLPVLVRFEDGVVFGTR